jgi:hypothetical protein
LLCSPAGAGLGAAAGAEVCPAAGAEPSCVAGAALCCALGAVLCCAAGAVVFTFVMIDVDVFPLLNITARRRHVIMKMTAAAVVILVKKEDAPAPPKTVWLEPPKAAPISAPLPFCKRTISISEMHTTICRIMITANIEKIYLRKQQTREYNQKKQKLQQ